MKTFNRSLIAAIGMLLMLSACSGGGSSDDDDNNNIPAANGRLYVADRLANRIVSFSNANAVDGNLMPITTLEGANTTLTSPRGIAIDTTNDYLYVANGLSNSILVFHNASTSTGNLAPDRVISNGGLLIPQGIGLDVANDRLFVSGNHGVFIYDNASSLNGVTLPDRSITGQTIGQFMAFDEVSDRLFAYNDRTIYVFDNASTTDGTLVATVDRTLTGMATGFFGSEGLFIDTAADRLYVPDRQISDSIRIWDNISTLDGNVAPDRVLSGVLTGIDDPRGIFVHPVTDELFVANQNPRAVHVFMSASVVDGDVAPIRSLTGAATLLTSEPFGLTVDITRD